MIESNLVIPSRVMAPHEAQDARKDPHCVP